MRTSIRIIPPSLWVKNYIVESLKKKKIKGVFCDKQIPIKTELLITNYLEEKELLTLSNLRFIIIPTSGTENIPIKKLKERGIKVYQDKSITSNGVIKYTLDMLSKISNNKINNLLKNKTIGLLGFGNIGEGVYNYLKEYNCKFMIIREKTNSKKLKKVTFIGGLKDLNYAICNSDIIINTLPLNESTKKAGFESKLKENSIFINLSRSGIFNEQKILEDTLNKKLSIAIMDVYPKSLNLSRYYNDPKIILTPHIAGIYKDSLENLSNYIMTTINKLSR